MAEPTLQEKVQTELFASQVILMEKIIKMTFKNIFLLLREDNIRKVTYIDGFIKVLII